MTEQTIGFIGAGNMASSLIGGLINKGISPCNILACDPSQTQRDKLVASVPSGAELQISPDSNPIGQAEIVVIAVKPQHLKEVALELAPKLKENVLIISIAAGISIASLESWFGKKAIVRCMPNTPALIQLGASGLFANSQTNAAQKTAALNILNAVGISYWVDKEALIDTVTAVSGSGPAYFFLFTELMSEIGQEMGLAKDVAESLSIQTCLGAGQLAKNSEDSLNTLRQKVTSPGGTTHAAIERFKSDDLKQLIKNAMHDCANRAEDMATEFGDL